MGSLVDKELKSGPKIGETLRPSTESNTRANPQIWRIAKWLYSKNFRCDICDGLDGWEYCKDYWYVTAQELLKKIQNNEFAGEDTHKD